MRVSKKEVETFRSPNRDNAMGGKYSDKGRALEIFTSPGNQKTVTLLVNSWMGFVIRTIRNGGEGMEKYSYLINELLHFRVTCGSRVNGLRNFRI